MAIQDLIRDVAEMVIDEFCAKPWGVPHVKFQISFDRKGRVEDITHTEIPPEHLDALLLRVREIAASHGKKLRGMLCTVIVGFRSPSRN
jgi:hypothetical protein